jgi:carotenoid cleavage dioxygenase-like enzyme
MTAPSAFSTPFHLQGNFAPIFDEVTLTDLPVTGAIPKELNGRFFRNGSNPKSGTSGHWFMGNGMLHGVRLEAGRAVWYRNRYVRTPLLDDPNAAAMGPDGKTDMAASLANTHVVAHAGKILALEEGHFPWIVSKELDTVGVHDFGGKLKTAMTAHPRICPVTGELLFFGYGALPPYLTYHRVAKDGTLVQSEEITVKGPTMMHDWNITRNYVVFMDLPMVFDLSLLAQGGIPIRWSDDYGARLGVMPRNGANKDVVWYEIEPSYVFHPMNAYEDGDDIVIDVSRFKKLAFSPQDGEGTPAVLHRWVIDRKAGKVREQPIDDRPADFPRVADECVGLKHRYGYMTGLASMDEFGGQLFKYDLMSGRSETLQLPKGNGAGEPVFARAGLGEDEGYVLTFVYDAARGASDLVIIDAQNFEKGPVAKVHLPRRVPYGFHGSWIAD